MNNDNKIFRFDEIRNASRMRERDEINKWIFQETSDKIKENDQKIEKNNRENERHDWKKYLNKNND